MQRAGDHARAMELMQRAITLDPKLDRAWYGLGISLAHVGRYEEAVAKFREAARLQPFNPYAGYHLGAVLAKLGRREELLAEYQRVKEFDPKISALMRREFGIDDVLLAKREPMIQKQNWPRAGRQTFYSISRHSWLHLRQRTEDAEISLKRA